MKELIYWAMWEHDDRPIKIVAKTWVDFVDTLGRMTYQRGAPPEWLQRTYK